MTRYLIVDGSAGAVGAVEGIRKLDSVGEIVVVTEESVAPYSRPARAWKSTKPWEGG